jgi:hypothetical protein
MQHALISVAAQCEMMAVRLLTVGTSCRADLDVNRKILGSVDGKLESLVVPRADLSSTLRADRRRSNLRENLPYRAQAQARAMQAFFRSAFALLKFVMDRTRDTARAARQ